MLHSQLTDKKVVSFIRNKTITFAGHKKLKIFGKLDCKSGKKMHRQNRIFFINEEEAIKAGYRPCGKCLPEKYKLWKSTLNRTNI